MNGRVHTSSIGVANGHRLMLSPSQRATGLHVIGAPGSGKSKAVEQLARQDIESGHAVIVIDPHESLYQGLVAHCAWRRPRRPVYLCDLSVGDMVQPLGLLAPVDGDPSVLVDRCVEGTIKACGMTNTDQTPRLEKWLRAFYAVLMERGVSLAEAEPLLDYYARDVRAYLAAGTSVEAEWRQLNEARTPTQFDDAIGSAKNRLQRFTRAQSVRRFLSVTDPAASLDLMRFMDTGGILLVNLKPSPHLSPMNARIFGTLLVTRIFDAARRRAVSDGGDHPKPCYCYVDECQNFLTLDVAEMLAQGRKTGLALTLIHQTLEQVRAEDPRILAALNGACRTQVVFNVGSAADAAELVHEIFPAQIDYNEVKRTDYEERFRPVEGFGITRSIGYGDAVTDTQGTQRARGRQRSLGVTVAAGRGSGRSQGHTDAVGSSSGLSSGQSLGSGIGFLSPIDGDGGTLTRSDFDGTSFGYVDSESAMSADSTGVFESQNLAAALAQQSGESESEGDTSSRALARTHSLSVSVGPLIKHVSYRQPSYTLYSLDEQRQRKADSLRCLPQRHCILRLPDGSAHRVRVDEVRPTLLSPRRVADYAAEVSRKAGALSAAAVETIIKERCQQIEVAAMVHLERRTSSDPLLSDRARTSPAYESTPRRIAARRVRPNPRLNPATEKAKPPKGPSGAEG